MAITTGQCNGSDGYLLGFLTGQKSDVESILLGWKNAGVYGKTANASSISAAFLHYVALRQTFMISIH
jgi:hypothetical protein